jgi:hypothetical protein
VETARAISPALLVVSATTPELLSPLAPELAKLVRSHRVAVAGAGAVGFDVIADGVLTLTGDPVAEAQRVSDL